MLRVSPLKSIQIFGLWDQPRSIVMWNDIKQHTWYKLRKEFKFEPQDLQTLQPDKHEWIKRGNLKLWDCQEMIMFPVNPYEDLDADLADVFSMEWTVDQWVQMGITYEQMRSRGLTPQIMKMMCFTLADWAKLRMLPEHVTAEIARLYNVDVPECQQILRDYA